MNLKAEDASWLIAKTSTDKTVLIGGQAVAFWIGYFGIEPRLKALTQDIDFLGTKAEAKAAASRLKQPHELRVASLQDVTSNSAILLVPIPGYDEPVIIDYLAVITGLESKAIRESAVTVVIEGQNIKVLHPIQLLQAKIWNLYQLPEKRTPEGIEQARLAIEIAAAYVQEIYTSQRELLDAIEAIAKFTATMPARKVKEVYGLDCGNAIPTSAFEEGLLPPEFHARRWAQLQRMMS